MANKKNTIKKINSALISVSDKANLKSILKILKKNNTKLISTGGTSIWITFFAFGILLSISRTNFLNNIELETEKINNES